MTVALLVDAATVALMLGAVVSGREVDAVAAEATATTKHGP